MCIHTHMYTRTLAQSIHIRVNANMCAYCCLTRTHTHTHTHTVIHSDGTYHIIIDQMPFLKGNILEDMTPPFLPDKEIDDPEDKMPSEWDEREK